MAGKANLRQGREPDGGVSVRLSAYIADPETLRLLEVAKKRLTPNKLARAIGRGLPLILEELGIEEYRCPACEEVSFQLDIKPGRRDADLWRCPKCGQASDFLTWREVDALAVAEAAERQAMETGADLP